MEWLFVNARKCPEFRNVDGALAGFALVHEWAMPNRRETSRCVRPASCREELSLDKTPA